MAMTVSGLNRFPVKSCRGAALDASAVEPWGLAGDRRWMVIDPDGDALTAREAHTMLLVVPAPLEDGLSITAPDLPELIVATPDGAVRVPCAVWGKPVDAAGAGAEADAWFSKVLNRSVRLVHLDDPTQRPTNPAFTGPDDRVSLADGYPLLLTTEASLTALNDLIVEDSGGAHEALPMIRFRPNLVVRGGHAWAEDDWRRIRVGGAGGVEFRVVKGCDRCVLTTLDPWTGDGGREPIRTLAQHRRWDGSTWFGMNLVPDLSGGMTGRIAVGDPIEVLEAVPAGNGPPR